MLLCSKVLKKRVLFCEFSAWICHVYKTNKKIFILVVPNQLIWLARATQLILCDFSNWTKIASKLPTLSYWQEAALIFFLPLSFFQLIFFFFSSYKFLSSSHYLFLRAIFQKKDKTLFKKGQIFENLGKNVQNLKIFSKRAGDCMRHNRTQ